MSTSVCWLCDQTAKLCESHIIPKFVFRWLIETGGSPYLRSGARPNVRQQDGDKHHIYCKNCEDRFSKWENAFSQKYFSPATLREDIRGPYGPWLSRFTASLAFRTIQSQRYRGILSQYDDTSLGFVEAAEKRWKDFLLDRAKHPAENRLFLIYLGYFDSFDADNLPSNWNSWVHRSVERDVIYTENGKFIATFSKLGPLILLGRVHDQDNLLGNDFLRCGDGHFTSPLGNVSKFLWELFLDRAHNASKVFDVLSEKQRQKINNQIRSDPKRFTNSDQARVMLDDHLQFGAGSETNE